MWLCVGVGHLVHLQALGVAEALGAFRAWQRFWVLVGITVEVEALVGYKHFITDCAVVALLLLVHLQVLAELLLLNESIPTEPALEGFCASVSLVVGLPVPFKCKCLVAVVAVVWLTAVVDLLVQHQAHQVRVGLSTAPAFVGFLSLVGSQVGLQMGLLVEPLVTLRTVCHLSATVGGTPQVTELRVITWRSRGQRSH